MSQFDIEIFGSANLKQPINQFGVLEKMVAAVNTEMQQLVQLQGMATNARGYQAMTRAVGHGSQVYRAAAASTGMFAAEQLRVNSATETYTKALQKQKLTFRQWYKDRKIANNAFREQLALQQMMVRQLPNTRGGKAVLDVIRPNAISAVGNQAEIARQRLGWMNEQLKSSSKQLVNWGKNTQWAGRQLMVGLTLPVVAFGAVAGKLAYDVDKQMTRIQKVYDTASDQFSSNVEEQVRAAAELARVRADAMNTAKAAAQDYGASMTDTLEVQAELAATGLKGAELQASTSEIMRIATLGEMEHADAINATISLQSVFNMKTKELTESFNYMNAVENATSLQLKDFAKAIPIAAAPVKMFGGDIHELGTLLVAMRENGIGAVQGANALKAAMQRLSRPSEKIQEEFSAITGKSIVDLVDNSNSLTEIFTKLGEVTEDLDKNQVRDVFAGLFGSYQVTRMTAMVEGMRDLEAGTGQVTRAANLAGEDVSTLADIAEREMDAIQKSVSGRFQRALQTMKVHLAEMGVPFLEIGTRIIEVIGKIVAAFNNLPNPVKTFLAWGGIITAIIGPLIMLTGLFANLAGNVLRMGSSIAGLILKFEVLDKESAAAKLIADKVAVAWDTEATAAERNAMMIGKMTAAMNESILAQRNMMAAQMGMPMIGQHFPGGYNPRGAVQGKNGRWRTPSGPGYPGVFTKAPIRMPAMPVLNPMVSPTMFPQSLVSAAPQVEKNTEKIKTHMNGAAISGGIFAGAMAASMFSSNETVDNVAHIAMVMAFVGPALWGLVKVLATINAGFIASGLAGMKAGILASGAWNGVSLAVMRTQYTMSLMPGIMAKTAVAAGGLASGIYAVLGPVGLLIAALTAAWFAMKKLREEAHEAADAYKEAYNNAEPLAEILGYTYQEVEDIDIKTKVGGTDVDKLQQIAGTYHEIVENIQRAGGEQEAYNEALRIGAQVISSGGTVDQAKEAVNLALQAGMNIAEDEANKIIMRFGGNMTDVEWTVQTAVTSAQKALDDALGSVNEKGWGEKIWQDATSGWNINMFEMKWSPSDDTVSDESIEAMKTAARDLAVVFRNEMAKQGEAPVFFENLNSQLETIDEKIRNATGSEKNVAEDMRKEFIKAQFAAAGMTGALEGLPDAFYQGANAAVIVRRLMGEITAQTELMTLKSKENPTIWDKVRMATLEVELGLEGAARAAKQAGNNMDETGRKTGKAAQEAKNFANALKAAKTINLADLFKGTMGDIQQGIADDTSSAFDARMDAALNATRAAGEARLNAFDAHADAASAAMERRFEARENHIQNMYDKRIETIQDAIDAEQKADEIRQRLFDAEMSRLDRLNDAANRNIDFNAALNEGNFDEAARIRNDAEAEATRFQLENALDRADQRSERRQKRMDNRIGNLEELRDKSLDNLAKIEEAEKAALQRSQERKRAALEAEVEADTAAAELMWETRRDFLDKALEDFTGYTAMSSKDLLKHMKNWEDEYGEFDLRTEDKFNRTVDDISRYLRKQISDQRKNLMNDAMWETMGGKIATKMIRGAFGMSKDQFWNWMAGGKPPKGVIKDNSPNIFGGKGDEEHTPGGRYAGGGVLPGWTPGRDVHHFSSPTGGNLHLSGGEAIMRPEFTRAVGGAAGVAAINKAARKGDSFASGGVFGPAGLMAGAMSRMMAGAFHEVVTNSISWALKRDVRKSSVGGLGSAVAGVYGNATLDAQQVANALIIAQVGKGLGASARDIQIALITAMTESTLRNLDYGDRDSVGLFQQRAPWGSFADRTNPAKSAKMFFTGGDASDGYSEPGLFDISDRNSMSMGQAAQAVQVSAYPDRYADWIPMAKALFAAMKQTGGQGKRGDGNLWYASDPGKGWNGNSHDYDNDYHDPVYAIAPGTVKAWTLPPTAGSGQHANAWPRGYGSFGVVSELTTDGGTKVLYAHLWPGTQLSGRVKGGQQIAESASTGNSSGSHTHFEVNGSENAKEWFEEHGIGLRKGAMNIKYDDVPAVLHKGEAVLTDDINKDFKKGVQNFANPASLLMAMGREVVNKIKGMDSESNKAAGLRIGTYNVHVTTPNAATANDLGRLLPQTDLLNLTEMISRKRGVKGFLKKNGWGMFGKRGPGRDTAIAYNKKVLDLMNGGEWKLNEPNAHGAGGGSHGGGPAVAGGYYPSRYATYGRFRDKRSGRTFWDASLHPIAHTDHHAPAVPIQLQQYKRLAELHEKLSNGGEPVFFGGDFNPGVLGMKRIVKMLGMDGFGDLKGLDHVLASGAEMAGSKRINKGMSSDHPAYLAQFNIPGLSSGGFTQKGGLARLHERELVVDQPRTDKLFGMIDRLASGGNSNYNLNMYFTGDVNDKDELARFVIKTIKQAESRKPQSRGRS